MHLMCSVLTFLAKIKTEIKENIIQYLRQKIVQSVINNHVLLMFLLHVSTSVRSSSGGYLQWHTSTANSVKDMHV